MCSIVLRACIEVLDLAFTCINHPSNKFQIYIFKIKWTSTKMVTLGYQVSQDAPFKCLASGHTLKAISPLILNIL